MPSRRKHLSRYVGVSPVGFPHVRGEELLDALGVRRSRCFDGDLATGGATQDDPMMAEWVHGTVISLSRSQVAWVSLV
jgi:hypothetical protein